MSKGLLRGKASVPTVWEAEKPKKRPSQVAILRMELPLLAGEVVRGDGIFEQGIVAGHDGDAGLGDEVILLVGLRIEADHGAFGDMHVAIDDRLLDLAVPAD